ncbi:MAG: MurR/RpiR family transcriptional regulator [Symbiobacterium sp.]|uniref:MurR/RpiR family transcriptional regulator n=1 Tax=Symbiobacterium sp. TaxID=1971213 RepID=UPI0034644E1C
MASAEPGTGLLLRIQSIHGSLTKAERRVADAVLSDPQAAIFDSVTDLAEKAGVGETTVLRFCRTLGCRGYQEFKLLLARDESLGARNLGEDLEESDDPGAILAKVTQNNADAVSKTGALLSPAAVDRAVEAIRRARRVEIYGVGTSGVTALDAMYRFRRIGINMTAIPDPHYAAMSAVLLGPEDVAIGISHSGSTKDTLAALRAARQAGATTICLTAHARSPITAEADIVLLTAPREAPLEGSSFAAKIAQIHALDVIYVALALRDRERSLRLTEKTASAVVDRLV